MSMHACLVILALWQVAPPDPVAAAAARAAEAQEAGNYDEAAAAFGEALGLAEEAGEPDRVMELLGQATSLAVTRGRPEEAVALQERVARWCGARGDHRRQGLVLTGQATQEERLLHRPDRALVLRERALDAARAAGNTLGLAITVADLAEFCSRLGDDPRALALSLRAQRLFEQANQADLMVRQVMSSGLIFRRLGDERAALAALEAAWRMSMSTDHLLTVASSAAARGEVLFLLGRMAEARDALVLSLSASSSRSDRITEAGTHFRFGRFLEAVGTADGAIESYAQALSTLEGVGVAQGSADAATALARLLLAAGRPADAVGVFRRVVGAATAAGAGPDLVAAGSLLAGTFGGLVPGEEALAVAEASRKAASEVGSPLFEAASGCALAAVRARQGSGEDALALLGEALDRARRGGSLAGEILARTALARLHLASGRAGEALSAARPGLAALRHLRVASGADLPAWAEEEVGALPRVALLAASALGDADGTAEALLTAGWHAMVDGLGGGRRLSVALLPEAATSALAQARAEEAVAEACLVAALRRGAKEDADVAGDRLAATRGALAAAVSRLAPQAGAGAALLDPASALPSAVRGGLREDEVLVLLFAEGGATGSVLLTPGEVRFVRLPDSEEALAAASALDAESPGLPEALDRLRVLLAAPLALPPAARRVFVCVSGEWARVPPGALFPDREVRLLPLAAALAHRRAGGGSAGRGVLAFGGPNYPPLGPGVNVFEFAGDLMAPLPDGSAEAEAFGDEVRVGEVASEAELYRALGTRARWRALHLAAHAAPNRVAPGLALVGLGPDVGGDGPVTAREVLRLSVPADLVVLSVFHPDEGPGSPVAGLACLAAAFQAAGAPGLLLPHWPVEPEARRAFLSEFYARFKAGGTAAVALRGAQEALRAGGAFAAPRYWAGWTLWGLPE